MQRGPRPSSYSRRSYREPRCKESGVGSTKSTIVTDSREIALLTVVRRCNIYSNHFFPLTSQLVDDITDYDRLYWQHALDNPSWAYPELRRCHSIWKTFHSYIIARVTKSTRTGTHFCTTPFTESKFFASPIEPFGDLTGAPWRLPLASFARIRDIMSCVSPYSAAPFTVPTPLEHRLFKGGYSGR